MATDKLTSLAPLNETFFLNLNATNCLINIDEIGQYDVYLQLILSKQHFIVQYISLLFFCRTAFSILTLPIC